MAPFSILIRHAGRYALREAAASAIRFYDFSIFDFHAASLWYMMPLIAASAAIRLRPMFAAASSLTALRHDAIMPAPLAPVIERCHIMPCYYYARCLLTPPLRFSLMPRHHGIR